MKGHVNNVTTGAIGWPTADIRDKHISDQGNVAWTSGIDGTKIPVCWCFRQGDMPTPVEQRKTDVMRMVEATVMVYRFMEEQHKLDSSLPKQPLILQDVKSS